MANQDILIVDDEIGIRELLSEILLDEGYSVALAENAEAARKYRNQGEPRLVLLDIWMPDTDGVTLLKEWARNGQLTMPVVMMSGHATVDTAVEATRIGALDFLEKPIGLQKLLATVKRAFSQPANAVKPAQGLQSLGNSTAINALREALDQVSSQTLPITLTGEPGSGFETCARHLTRPNTPFISPGSNEELALPPQDILNRATGGTIFVRDIAWLDRKAQTGLLNLLPKLEKYKIRLVTASSRPLDQLINQCEPELVRQLTQVIIAVPPLRQHAEDIASLAETLLAQTVSSNKLGPRRFSKSALQLLSQQEWPGNIDQLANVVKSLAITGRDGDIDILPVSRLLTQLSPNSQEATLGVAPQAMPLPQIDLDLPLREARDQFERFYLERQIELSNGNMSRVAERIGLERTHLYRKLKQLGIQMPRKQRASEEQ